MPAMMSNSPILFNTIKHSLIRCGIRKSLITNRSYVTTKSQLIDIYNAEKSFVKAMPPLVDQHPHAVFANNELSLSQVEVYGFDYDYTLATYTNELHKLIFSLGKQALVNKLKYPAEILDLEYDENFAVRGLHYDTRKGLLMKIDQFHNVQLGTVFRGMTPVPDEEVKEIYEGTHIPVENMNTFYGKGAMYQKVDLFALPEVTLIALITEYFIENNITYDPEYVFYDIGTMVQGIHKSGILHQAIMKNLDIYMNMDKCQETKDLLEGLAKQGKQLFLVTNSGFPFIDAGMSYIIGKDWRDLFDIVICSARKPKFFTEGSRPFRVYNHEKMAPEWGRVTSLSKGLVYHQGNHKELQRMTGWYGPRVLYAGDHVYSDLAIFETAETNHYNIKKIMQDPSLRYGWRTLAIIPELEDEISKQNSDKYKANVRWMVSLQNLIDEMQHQNSPESKEVIREWLQERDELRVITKSICNPYFGSLFRTYHNPTYFFRRLARFADIYTSNITNLLSYSSNYTFYPHRILLPHERSVYQYGSREEKN